MNSLERARIALRKFIIENPEKVKRDLEQMPRELKNDIKFNPLKGKLGRGYISLPKYSETEESDKFGRWGREFFYNGLPIFYIDGFTKIEDKIDKIPNTICNNFIVNLKFPISSNGTAASEIFDTFEEATKFGIKLFEKFKKRINKHA
jgi:hypothetical protein